MVPPRSSGSPERILRPRVVRPGNPLLSRTQTDDNHLHVEDIPSGISSGRNTPLPADAPPSLHSISSARRQARSDAKRRLFHTIDYFPRVSHFDPDSDYHDFKGFFVLFWIGLTIMVFTTALRNIKDTGHPMRGGVYRVMSENAISLALSDAVMVGTTFVSLPLQRMYRSGSKLVTWRKGGFWLQSIYQIGWLVLWTQWPFMLRWKWTAQVFFQLHTLVMGMKMHSYAFYNGHLSETERRLRSLDKPGNLSLDAAVRYPSSPSRLRGVDANDAEEKKHETTEKLHRLRSDLATELTSPLGHVSYPQNLTLYNYCDFICCPTLCYEIEYPRNSTFRWSELCWKVLAIFGCIFLLTLISEEFITPVLADSAVRLQRFETLSDKGLILAETVSMLLFPFMITFLLVFLVIFEYICGAFAEITHFADRQFYSDWWNSSDWLEFSREWNIPVHHFLRRHVYFAAKSYTSNTIALALTFFISSALHELIMGCITKKLRGYSFFAMMLQLPIMAIQRSKFFRGRWIFNNAAFWSSMVLGLSAMCALYVLV